MVTKIRQNQTKTGQISVLWKIWRQFLHVW